MSSIKTYFINSGWQESRNRTCMVRGSAFIEGINKSGSELAISLPIAGADIESWENALHALNGFFAVVALGENILFAAVDRIRSIPLFYGRFNNQLFLSDDAEWVRTQVGDKEMDPVAREEFQLAGYVTGQDTLFPNVKQLQAGEFLVVCEDEQGIEVSCHRYYRFTHTEPDHFDEQQLRKALDQAALQSVKRLVDYAGGRQIVIPLSGGYDSRLIATLLKRLGYENILAFSYGVPGNKESKYSRQIADSLGIPWHFVEYSKDKWRKAWQTDERREYQRWGSGWCSIPHVQDWLAVKIMKENKTVDENCIFVPGHSGDFVAGSHLPSITFTDKRFSFENLYEAIHKKHYELVPFNVVTQLSKAVLKKRILTAAEKSQVNNNIDFADGFEKWDWQERQAKFICNSVRVYEFFSYDWWMPLWDGQFMAFWESVPLRLRKNRYWYADYVKNIYAQEGDEQNQALDNPSDQRTIRSWIKNYIPPIAYSLLLFVKPVKPSAWISQRSLDRYPQNQVQSLLKKGYKHNGIVAHFFLREQGLLK